MKVFYYTLSDPDTSEVCYVGKTSDPNRRHKEHCSQPGNFKGNAYMTMWISGLSKESKMPIMKIIDYLEEDFSGETSKRERFWIKEKWASGHPLLNRDKFLRSYRKNNGQDYKLYKDRLNNSKWNILRHNGKIIFH